MLKTSKSDQKLDVESLVTIRLRFSLARSEYSVSVRIALRKWAGLTSDFGLLHSPTVHDFLFHVQT